MTETTGTILQHSEKLQIKSKTQSNEKDSSDPRSSREGVNAIPTTSDFFFFPETIKHLDIFSSCFIYPSHEFCHEFSDQLLWLRDMTSKLVGAVKPFLSKSVCFSSFYNVKSKAC